MPIGYRELLERADAAVPSMSVSVVVSLAGNPDVVIVDIRDIRELERDGMIEGARHAPRGMLEFWIDPESPYHKPWFAEGKTFIFYCASGWRSLLAAEIAQAMGLDVASMRGGITAWKEAGHPVSPLARKP